MTPRGVLLIGHGTRDAIGTAEFFQLSDRLTERLAGSAIVRPCLLEFQQPTIAEAWCSLVNEGVCNVVAAPLLLFSAGHAKSDIPDEIAAAREKNPGSDHVAVSYSQPISRQSAMIDAVRSRLRETLSRGTTTSGRTAIVMVGRGSRDVCASSDMRVLSEVAVRGRDPLTGLSIADEFQIPTDGLQTTFYAMATPRLPETLAEIAESGRFQRVIVHPHLLFAGRLYDAIVEQVSQAAGCGAEFLVSEYLGPSESIAAAVAARIVAPS
jgi:sirohydrochlorin cobaltochelatase